MSAESGYGAPPGSDEPHLPDISAVTAAPATSNNPTMDKRATRFSWTPAYETTFFRSLCESVQLGLRENHSFKPEAWDRAAASLREKHGAYPTKAHLVNKSDNARKKFRLWRGLREHPEFLYNPVSKSVTASEEAWKEHVEKEPLSRSLRGRPFEHEDFMEILYPDVIGSGGAPKRIMKPRRKGPDHIAGNEELDPPGTTVIDLAPNSFGSAKGGAASVGGNIQHVNTGGARRTSAAATTAHSRPTSGGRPAANGSALTPPDDTTPGSASHNRKRFAPEAPFQANKTRRNPAGFGTTTTTTTSQYNTSPYHNQNSGGISVILEEALSTLNDTLLRSRAASAKPKWPEQAVEVFFRDFGDEDMDLQLKVAEKVLTDENKAMVFVKMPPQLRSHYISRLREANNRGGGAGVIASGNVIG